MIGPKTGALMAGVGATLILAVPANSGSLTGSQAGAPQAGPTVSSAVSTANRLARVARPKRTWQRLPAAPIPAPYTLASVWTGSQMLIFGRVSRASPARGFDVLAAYRPASTTWRRLASGPGPKGESEGLASAVWTGTEMIVWGKANAAFSPLTGRRRALPASPIASRGAPTLVVWTGSQMIGWGGGCCGEAAADGAAYTPRTNSWQKLPTGPLAGRHASGAWTGRDLIIAGGSNAEGKVFADAAAYNPATNSWRRIANLPVPLEGGVAVWDGREVLLLGGQSPQGGRLRLVTKGFAYNPATNRWRRLPAVGGRIGQVAVWTGRLLLMWGGETLRAGAVVAPPRGVLYDPAHNRWSTLPVSPLRGRVSPTAVWTGHQMIVWGGRSVGKPTPHSLNDGAAYTP
jgi:N-acetylneuraminic acid mutarotase